MAAVAVLIIFSGVLQSRPWGGSAPIAPGIEVVAPPRVAPGDAEAGAGGHQAPRLESESGEALGPGDGVAQAGPVLQIPDISGTLRSLFARSDSAEPEYVYRSAVTARDSADYALAVELFDRVAEGGGPLAPFASLRAAQMSVLAGSSGEGAPLPTPADRFAAITAVGGSGSQLPDTLRAVALTEAAGALEQAGRVDEALAVLDQLGALDVGAATRAQGLWERARIQEEHARGGWESLAIETMAVAPTSAAARSSLDLLDDRGGSYPPLIGAFVAYRGGRNADATERYEDLLAAGALDAEEAHTAWFYLGALRERAFEREPALEAYASSIAAAPAGRLADDARYWRGRVLEELGRPGAAVVEYDLLEATFPGSNFAEDGRLRAAVALGLSGAGAEATARLAEITRTGSSATAAEAAHWHTVLVALFDAPPA